MVHKKTEVICGESEIIPDFDEIGSNPNFVFEPDPDFNPITLFNEEGSSVMVNSWLECANYVNGNWTNNISDFFNGEKVLFFFMLGFVSVYFVFKKKIRFK